MDLHIVRFANLDARTLYAVLRLRCDVFVVEQHCPYPELDGRDLEETTLHLWLAVEADPPQAYLRLLRDSDGAARIGRVCTAPTARAGGLASRLVTAALAEAGPGPVVLEAQSYLVDFYARFGFAVRGPEYVEDGIPHIPMIRY